MKTLSRRDEKMKLQFLLWRSKENRKGLCPIYLRIRMEGLPDAELSTGVFISAEQEDSDNCQWDQRRKLVINHPEADELNGVLAQIKTDMKFFRELIARSELLVTPAVIKKAYMKREDPKVTLLLAAKEWFETKQQEKISKQSRDTYKPRFATLKLYLNEKNLVPVLCEQVNHDFITRYEHWLATRKKKDGKLYHVNYNAKMLDFLLSITKYAYKRDYAPFDYGRDYSVTRRGPSKPKYIPMEVLDKIEQFEFENPLLRKVVDVYLFMCATGMAHIEMWRFNAEEHIKPTYEGFDWIETDRQKMNKYDEKTGKICYIPVIPLTKRILLKYDNVLPRIGNTSSSSCTLMNRYLEVAFMMMGMEKHTSHTARKTAANMWEEMGIPEKVISDCLGNSVAILRKHYLDRSRVVKKTIATGFKKAYMPIQEVVRPTSFTGFRLVRPAVILEISDNKLNN